jgi:hypothetical protein
MADWKRLHDRDVHHDFTWNFGVPGFAPFWVEVGEGHTPPWWFRVSVYLFASLLGLSWGFRVRMSSLSGKRNEFVRKTVW